MYPPREGDDLPGPLHPADAAEEPEGVAGLEQADGQHADALDAAVARLPPELGEGVAQHAFRRDSAGRGLRAVRLLVPLLNDARAGVRGLGERRIAVACPADPPASPADEQTSSLTSIGRPGSRRNSLRSAAVVISVAHVGRRVGLVLGWRSLLRSASARATCCWPAPG